MTSRIITMPKPHPTQREYLRGVSRFNVLCCGRRWGKNVISHRRIVKAALPGAPCAWFAPTYRMLSMDWGELTTRLANVTARKSETEHRIDLLGGGCIEMWSLDNPDAVRGRHYRHAIINEAAMVKNLFDVWNNVIRPTLADLRGGADFPSTPRGLNDYYNLWQLAGDNADWSRAHYPTSANPHIPAEEIEAMRLSMPERVFRQEIMAEFVEDGSYFQNVDACASLDTCDQPEQHTGHHIVGGLDWAMTNDYTVLTLGCRECNRAVYWDRFNQIDYTYQRARVLDACQRWHIAGLLPERNSIGEPNIELLIAAGVPVLDGPDDKPGFNTTATSKPALIQRLASALEHDGYQVPRDYADELRSYEVETMAGGHPRFSAPDGRHDDRVISLALCWWAMTAIRRATFEDVADLGHIDDLESRWR